MKCVEEYRGVRSMLHPPFLTLGVHAQESYGTCLVYICVCMSVTTLTSTLFISTVQARYVKIFSLTRVLSQSLMHMQHHFSAKVFHFICDVLSLYPNHYSFPDNSDFKCTPHILYPVLT